MLEPEINQDGEFFTRFATFDLVVIAVFVGLWYGLQQVLFVGIAAIPAPISWVVSVIMYELLAMTLVMLAATFIKKGGTVILIFFLHGLLEVVLFPNIFSLVGLAADVMPGILIEVFFYATGGYPGGPWALKSMMKTGIGATFRALVTYPFQLLLLTVTFPEYVEFVEFFYGINYGVFIILNVVIGVIFGFIAGVIGYSIGQKVKEAI